MKQKYEFTGETMQYDGRTLHRIRALRDLDIYTCRSGFCNIHIKAGDIGGWILSEDNLSHEGNCWVDGNAKIYGYAEIQDNAYVGGEAIVCGSKICGRAKVVENANVKGFVNVFGEAVIGGNAVVRYRSQIGGNATILGDTVVEYSNIGGNATIAGAIKVHCKTLNEGLYDCEDDFREETPPPRTKRTHRSSVDFEALKQAHGEFCMSLLLGY